jgi:hypothetical protein
MTIACFVRTALLVAFAGIATFLVSTAAAEPKKGSGGSGTKPTPKIYACGGQLTRAADRIITMQSNTAFYKSTVDDAPVTTQPVGDVNTITAIEAKLLACTRRVIEIRVPSTASSGCADCKPSAEINVCAGSFAGSKEFEEHCRVPASPTSAADCKTFNHAVAVYKKPSGVASFTPTALKTFNYKGFIDGSGCRVAAKNFGQIYDTAEVYANVTPPSSGTDVYRVLTLPKYKGELVDTVIFIEFEKRRR